MATTTRRRIQYDGRSYGSAPAPSQDARPKKDRAADALTEIVGLFESGNLPAAIAQTTIQRLADDCPTATWSLGNQLLAMLAGTSDARGYRQWQEVGRHVSKGAKAVYILAPCTRKIHETDKATGEEASRVIVTGFRAVPVFRFEDTEGAPLELVDYSPPQLPPLYEVAERLGISVSYHPVAGNFRGYYSPGQSKIVLCSHDAETFFHELAHAAHATIKPLKGGQDAAQEIVAETVAATLCHLYELDGSLTHASEYIQHYASGENPGRAAVRVLAEVQRVLDVILTAAEPVAVAA